MLLLIQLYILFQCSISCAFRFIPKCVNVGVRQVYIFLCHSEYASDMKQMKKRVFNWTICCGLWYLVVFYRMFGFVARRSGGLGNVCHLFAELDPEQPATAIVNFINKVMLGPQQLRKWTQYRRDGEKQNRAHKMVLQWILSVLLLYIQNERSVSR